MRKIDLTKYKTAYLITGLFCIVGIFFFGMYNWGKYLSRQTDDQPVKAVEMFFTSDLLKELGDSTGEYDYIISEWDDEDSIKIQLRNYPDSQRFTNREIVYTVETDYSEATFSSQGVGITSTSGKTEELTLPKSTSASEQSSETIDISLPNLFDGGETSKIVTVTATTSSPYIQTITAKFLIEKAATGFNVNVVDALDSPFATVTITTEKDRDFKLAWKEALVVPDQTNPVFYGKSITASSAPYNREISLGTVKDTGAITFYMLKYDEGEVYDNTNYTNAFEVIEVPGGG
ncbi:hypothetical protein JZO70_03810 [Enterococcus sp. 669A]|uniref:Uncharacterized protein n=1 Tax=Candidatus Enterococcus moelleringii TaxID=2815325 RepID=A0ABS3L6N3_9ENTE|nr:hypothetical protein [Enterococcus sp. 669A]MBO1305273.1 hypothetical protein [Enterococcus sp. 669A]